MTSRTEHVPSGQPRARILVVEDDRIVALDLRDALSGMGYEVVGTAASEQGALSLAAERRPDLVLMDIRIEGKTDGITAAHALGQRYEVPVVYLTADGDERTLKRALETEPAGYLVKPYAETSLRAAVELGLSHRLQRERLDTLERENARLARNSCELAMLSESLRRESLLDVLTGLGNRRHFDSALARELSLLGRRGGHIGLILLDVDDFKPLNDTYGHAAGDRALRALGRLLLECLRPYDVPCRVGGDEIAVIVPRSTRAETLELAERLLSGVHALEVFDAEKRRLPLAVSIGCAGGAVSMDDGERLYRAADASLYTSKARGGDCVTAAPTLDPPSPPARHLHVGMGGTRGVS